MAGVTIHSDFGVQKNKVCHCLHFFCIYFHEVMGPHVMIFILWMLSFKPAFSLSSFFVTLHKTTSSPRWSLIELYALLDYKINKSCIYYLNNFKTITHELSSNLRSSWYSQKSGIIRNTCIHWLSIEISGNLVSFFISTIPTTTNTWNINLQLIPFPLWLIIIVPQIHTILPSQLNNK